MSDHELSSKKESRISLWKKLCVGAAAIAATTGLAACGANNAGAEKPPTVATASATPGASETPITTPSASETMTSTPSASETTLGAEVSLSVLDNKTYSQATVDMPLEESEKLDKKIVDMVNLPSEEWAKLSQGEQAYRGGLYVEMTSAWSLKYLADSHEAGYALDNDKSYPGVTPFITQDDFDKLSCMTPEGIKELQKVEMIRRAWNYTVGHSSIEGVYTPQIRENLTKTGIYQTSEGNAEITDTIFDDESGISKIDVTKLLGKNHTCGFGLSEQQFLYNVSGEEIWINSPNNKPVAGISAELVSTGHKGRFAKVLLAQQNG